VITKQMQAAAGKELTSKTTKFVREQLVRVLTGEEGAREAFASVLAEYQLTMDDLATVAFREQMQLQLEIDNRSDAAHNRRNGAYAELEALREQILRADTPSLPMRYIEAPGSIAPTGAVDAAGRGPATDQTSTNTIPPHTEPARVSGDRVIDDDPDPS
jgi:hypothetical protein